MAVSTRPCAFERLEARQLCTAEHAVAVNFNDESLWNNNFDTAVAQAKSLGVTAVRLWLGFNSYDDRPNAWDPVAEYGPANPAAPGATTNNTGNAARTVSRIFQLARDGFSVLLVMNNNNGLAPASSAQAKAFVRHLMDATETPTSTQTLCDVVDYWEIGNEPDSGAYWAPSAINKTTGLQSYVDSWLIPAAEELHSNPAPEKVVSAGVSYSPADLSTVVGELTARGALADVDYLGFHPYGTVTAAADNIALSTAAAVKIAAAAAKPLMATEWNIRGFGNAGANDVQWAATMDQVYRQTILPNYSNAFYFALTNNWAARGGVTSARPGGLLKHDTTLSVTPSSSLSDLAAYYNAPLIAADPFYTTFSQWQYASAAAAPAPLPPAIDPAPLPADGNPPVAAPVDSTLPIVTAPIITGPVITVPVIAAPVVAPPPVALTTGSISGILWNDGDADGLIGANETFTGARVVFIDANRNGKLDAGEMQITSDASSNYSFGKLAAGTYYLSRVFPAGYRMSNSAVSYLTVQVLAGQAVTGVNIGTTNRPAVIATPPATSPIGPPIAAPVTAPVAVVPVATVPVAVPPIAVAPIVAPPAVSPPAVTPPSATAPVDLPIIVPIAISPVIVPTAPAGQTPVAPALPSPAPTLPAPSPTADPTVAPQATPIPVLTQPIASPPIVSPPVVVTPIVTPPAVSPPITTIPIASPVVAPPVVIPPASIGTASIAGTIFASSGSYSAALYAAGWTAYLDANGNGIFDAGEISTAVSTTTGTYAFKNLAAGSYTVALDAKAGWASSASVASRLSVALGNGVAKTGQNFVIQKLAAAAPVVSPPPAPAPPAAATASIAGKVFAQLSKWTAALLAQPMTLFLDTNKNGALDAGEASTLMNADTSFAFSNLAAGNYTLALQTPINWAITTPGSKSFPITLGAGQAKAGQNFIVQKLA